MTVDSIEEYGYGSIEEMANAVWTGCKIWYRGENTGVVVLYTKTPSLYRIENAWTQRYITDAHSKQILTHSKADGVCEKKDVSCRLDDITEEIGRLIRKEFPDAQAVQALKQSTQKFDEKESVKETDEFLNNLWIGAVILVVLWGWAVGWNTLVKRNRRKALKKQIFELSIRLQTEKAKYPEWFLLRHAREAEQAMDRLESYSDNQLDSIINGWRQDIMFYRDINTVNTIALLEAKFEEITRNVKIRTDEVARQMIDVATLQKSLEEEWFKFDIVQVSTVREWSNPDETLSLLEWISSNLTKYADKLRAIPGIYNSVKGLDVQVTQGLVAKQAELTKTLQEHATIFESQNQITLPKDMESKVDQFVKDFQSAYQSKDISKLERLSKQATSILSPIWNAIESLKTDIKWYQGVPEKVAKRQKFIRWVQVRSEYTEEAWKYAEKTGKRAFVGYNMWAGLVVLQQLLASIIQDHSQKKNLSEIEVKITKFDAEYSKVKEYIGLGAVLAALIAEEIAEAARVERRRLEEEQRRRDEEERRRRRQEEEEDDRRRRRDEDSRSSSSSSSSSDSYPSGGGSGYSGGGSTSD